jgi:O-antigen ligase
VDFFFFLPFTTLFLANRVSFLILDSQNKAILAFVFLCLALVFFSESFLRGGLGFVHLSFFTSIYFYMLLFTHKKKCEKPILDIFNVVCAYLSFFALLEIVLDQPLSALKQFSSPANVYFAGHRISSSIGTTLPFGVVYAYCSTYLFNKFIRNPTVIRLFFMLVSIYILLATFSRSAFGVFVIGAGLCFVFAMWERFERKLLLYYIGGALLAIFLAWEFTPASVADRLVAGLDWSAHGSNLLRLHHWRQAVFAVSLDEIFFGKSLASSGNLISHFSIPPLLEKVKVTESFYLKLYTETGVIGLSLFLLFLLFSCISTWSTYWKVTDEKSRELLTFILSVTIAQSVQLMFLQSLEATGVGAIFFFTIGCGKVLELKTSPRPA